MRNTGMTNDLMERASAMALDLCAARVDPNEAQKALTYLRAQKDSKAYFAYLQAIVKNGRAVIRSNRTIEYYSNLLTASQQHLRDLSPHDMALTLGWTIRLLRYYNAVPEEERQPLDVVHVPTPSSDPLPSPAPSRPPSATQSAPARPSPSLAQPAARPPSAPSPAPPAAQTAPPAPPASIPLPGEVFSGEVLEVDEDAVAVKVKNFNPKRVIGVIRAEMIPDRNTARYSAGNTARVEVVAVQKKGDRTILELKPAPKKKARS
ncbi:MAG: hypothetical protein KatS3mg058_0963 [Roseiflexus sp.]|nr:MAG: hypothetical protein KatS3mg058_0963 [Roseiflexus sp.]